MVVVLGMMCYVQVCVCVCVCVCCGKGVRVCMTSQVFTEGFMRDEKE